jgi:hypothetical protein
MSERNLSGVYVAKAGPVIAPCVKAIDPEKGTYEVLISTSHRDRDGDSVRQQSMSTKNYVRNKAPIFWGHESRGLPIGKTVKIRREKLADGAYGTWATPKLAVDVADYPLPRIVRDLLALDMCGPSSIGFMIHDAKELPDDMLTDEERAARKDGRGVRGALLTATELLEWSFVGIPANPNVDIAQAGLDRERVETIHEVAARYLSGGALKDFIRPLPYAESVRIGVLGLDGAPERVKRYVSGATFVADVDDPGFDLTVKAADPEPEPVDDGPPVAPVVEAKAVEPVAEKASGDVIGLGIVIGAISALVDRLGTVADRLESACAAMEAEDAAEASAYGEMAARVESIKHHIDDVVVDVWGRKEDEVAHARKQTHTSKTVAVIPAAAPVDAKPAGDAVAKAAAQRLAALENKLDKFFGVHTPTRRSVP